LKLQYFLEFKFEMNWLNTPGYLPKQSLAGGPVTRSSATQALTRVKIAMVAEELTAGEIGGDRRRFRAS
jgi:hypothetical protein